MIATLLATKLYVPPLRGERVARPRLTGRLRLGRDRKLTLLSAPAGFGKTTLLSEWIRAEGGMASGSPEGCSAFAWLSIDAEDNDPVRFWTYFVAALRTIPFLRVAGLGATTAETLHSIDSAPVMASPPWEVLLSVLVNEVAEVGRPFVLVLDDFHLITEPQIHSGLTFLLENLPPADQGMHLVVAGRADPPWPLARMRARGQVAEVRAADLRFTLEETASFFNDVAGLGLSPEDVLALDGRTEGWIAGLQMAALSMKGRQGKEAQCDLSSFVAALSGSHRYVLDYLVEEVLDQQPPDVTEFLLKTSVLERLTAPLCDAVWEPPAGAEKRAGDASQRMLERLEAANLFLLPLDDERRWYRYHPLFADLLRRRLAQRIGPGGVTALHLTASGWFEQTNLTIEAVSHALASGDAERLAHLVERNALAALFQGQRATAVRWLEALSENMVRSRPWLCLAYAWVMASSGQWDMVESLLASAERSSRLWEIERCGGRPEGGAQPRSRDPEARRLAGHFLTLQAYVTGIKGDVDTARELARSALECVPAEDRSIRSFAATLLGSTLRLSGDLAGASRIWSEALAESRLCGDAQSAIVLLGSLASLQVEQAQLHRAAETSRQVLDLAREQSGRGAWLYPLLGTTHSRLSMIHLEWNDVPAALSHAREGLRLSELWGHLEALATGQMVLAWALQAAGDAAGALTAIRKAGELADRLSAWYRARAEGERARICLAQGNLDAAARWAAECDLDQDRIAFDRMREYLLLARVLVLTGRADKALDLLSRLLETAEATGSVKDVVETLVVKALALQAQRDVESSLSALERALAVTEPEGHIRTYTGEGEALETLLRRAAARGFSPAYVNRLLEAFPAQVAEREAAGPPAGHQATPGFVPFPLVEPLSERELEVLRLLDTSLSVPEIADRLVVSPSTVRSHVKSVYGKLGAHNRLQALEYARELKLLS